MIGNGRRKRMRMLQTGTSGVLLATCLHPPSSLFRISSFYCVCKQVEVASNGAHQRVASSFTTRRVALQRLLLLPTTVTCSEFNRSVLQYAFADEEEGIMPALRSCNDLTITNKVYFDISIDSQPADRIVVGLFGEDVPTGAKRFFEMVIGKNGVSYRKKEFYKITSSYVQNVGIRKFSLSGETLDAAKFTVGETAEQLIPELNILDKKCIGTKNLKGTVSLVVKDPTRPPPNTKLIAKGGKFEFVQEESRPNPNGTEFVIVTEDSPELDTNNLVVGRVLEGMDVVHKIAAVKAVKKNTSSLYFQTAKLIGDTRALVAERGFNRPYSKIVITNCGESL